MNYFTKFRIKFLARIRLSKISSGDENSVVGIVFSKDRPIQLHALLESYAHYTDNPAQLVVLYDVSDNNYQRGYDELQLLWPQVQFVKEVGFRKSLIKLLNCLRTEKIFFLVDDIIFNRHYDLKAILAIDCKRYIPSLRMGENITYSYVRNKPIQQPVFETLSESLISWVWSTKNSYWSYPLSVDGHFFNLKEVIVLLELIQFKAPNSLEAGLQIFTPIFSKRKGVAFRNSVIVNAPWNMVQTEIVNQNESISPEYLLNQWNLHQRINFLSYENGIYNSPHVALPLSLISR